MMYELDDSEFRAFAIGRRRPCLVEFYAEWCGPSKHMFPVLTSVARQFSSRLDVVRMNIDRNPETPQQYGVRGIPTMIVFNDGAAAATKVGSMPENVLTRWLGDLVVSKNDETNVAPELLAVAAVGGILRVVKLLEDGSYNFFDDAERLHNGLYLISTAAAPITKAVREFEKMINDPALKERHFQEFFEAYPELVLNDDYRKAHSHIVLERPAGDLIPDFMLEPINQQYLCDILDIKTPSAKLVTLKKNRPRLSSAVYEGIAQLREYQAYFEDPRARALVEDKYKLIAYRPRMFLIIGRLATVDPLVLKRIRQDSQGVEVQTFDDLLLRAKAKYKL